MATFLFIGLSTMCFILFYTFFFAYSFQAILANFDTGTESSLQIFVDYFRAIYYI
jgi:hypothetical protein